MFIYYYYELIEKVRLKFVKVASDRFCEAKPEHDLVLQFAWERSLTLESR